MDDDYLKDIQCRSSELRKKNGMKRTSKVNLGFSDPESKFYEEAVIYSIFYDAGNFPSNDKLESDLISISTLYDEMAENNFPRFIRELYSEEVEIALAELKQGYIQRSSRVR